MHWNHTSWSSWSLRSLRKKCTLCHRQIDYQCFQCLAVKRSCLVFSCLAHRHQSVTSRLCTEVGGRKLVMVGSSCSSRSGNGSCHEGVVVMVVMLRNHGRGRNAVARGSRRPRKVTRRSHQWRRRLVGWRVGGKWRHGRTWRGWGWCQRLAAHVRAGWGRAWWTVVGWRVHSLFFLPAVAKPNPDDFLFHAEAVGHVGDFFRGRLGVGVEGSFQRQPNGSVNGGSFFSLSAERLVAGKTRRGGHVVGGAGGSAVVFVRVFQPLGEQRLELAHVLERKVESLEARNGCLREIVAVHFTHGQTDITLGVSKFNSLLFEQLGKSFQLFKIGVLLWRQVKTFWQWHRRAGWAAAPGWTWWEAHAVV